MMRALSRFTVAAGAFALGCTLALSPLGPAALAPCAYAETGSGAQGALMAGGSFDGDGGAGGSGRAGGESPVPDGGDADRPAQLVVVFEDETTAGRAARTLMGVDSVDRVPKLAVRGPLRYALVDVDESKDVEDAAAELSSAAGVAYVQPNYHYRLAAAGEGAGAAETAAAGEGAGTAETADAGEGAQAAGPDRIRVDDPLATNERQWHLDSIGARDAWEYAKADGKVTVAVIDTGIQMNHADLKDGIVGPYDVTGDARTDATASVPDFSPDDQDGHGTHVAGIVAARSNNATGVSGVSYNANIMPIRVFYYSARAGAPVADSVDIAAAYEYLLSPASGDLNGDGVRGTVAEEYNVRVANMSLGSLWAGDDMLDGSDQLILDMIDRADEAGLLTVCAAGNDGVSARHFPGDHDTCISVIALDSDDGRAYYSNYGADKDIAAPGTNVYSTLNRSFGQSEGESFKAPDGNDYYYGRMSGTSMASPVVAGVAALMFAANGNLTPDRVKQALYDTATDLGTPGRDVNFGWGKVNAAAAVKAVAYTAVESVDSLPAEVPAARDFMLEGAVLPATATRTAVGYEVVDDGGTGATVDGRRFFAPYPGECTCRATVVNGIDMGVDFTQDFVVRVVASDISQAGITVEGLQDSYVYCGDELRPEPALKAGQRELRLGTDYVLGYRDNVNAGTAQIVVYGRGGYFGKLSVPFAIVPARLDDAEIGPISSRAYTGAALTPAVAAQLGSRYLVPGIDYALEYRDNVNPGTALAVMSGMGNFAGTRQVPFTITGSAVKAAFAQTGPQQLALKAGAKSVKASKLKGKALTVKPFSVTGASGKVVYRKASGSKRLSVNAKTGKVKVRKGTKKGSYKIRVKATCGGRTAYATAKIRVK